MNLRVSLLVACAALFLGACGNLFEPAAAVVGGNKITVEEISRARERFEQTMQFERLAQEGDESAIKRQFEQGFLAQEIRRQVLEPRAEEFGIEVTEEEVQERMDQIESGYGSPSAFAEALREQGLTVPDLRILVRDRTLEEKMRAEITQDVGATEEEVAEYYEEHLQEFTVFRARHVLVENEQRAREISQELASLKGQARDDAFARLARRESLDQQSGEQGGDLGFFGSGDLVKPFENAAYSLDIGEISEPVQSEFGWHVIEVLERATDPLSAVDDQIEEDLSGPARDEAWNEWVMEAYEEVDVEVNPRYGELDLATQQILDPSAEDLPGAEVPPTETTPTGPSVPIPTAT